MAASWTLVLVAVVSFLVIGHIETTVAQDLPAATTSTEDSAAAGATDEGPTTANSSTTPTNGNDVTVDQLLGKWYLVSIIFPYIDTKSRRSCMEMNIVRGHNGDESFDAFVLANGRHDRSVTYVKGRIDNNKMITHYQNFPNDEFVQTLKFYNSGKEVIAKYENKDHYELYSRSTKASLETVDIFESVIKPNMTLFYVYHNNCP